MEKLTIEEVAPYLPYGLKAISDRTKEVRNVTLLHFTYDTETVGHNHLIYEGLILDKHKPLLYPLSHLTNEMLRIEMSRIGQSAYIDYTTKERKEYIEKYSYDLWLNKLPYSIVQYLFKNKYDVFNLIDRNLAIDVTKLETNPYENI